MFGFIKRLLGLEAPKPVKVFPVTEVTTPVVKVETTEVKSKKKTTVKKSTGTRKPRKKKD